jgi:hypothetical protein
MFPRYPLDDALEWTKKLVSKTHTGPQPRDIVYSGVVGAKSGTGDVKISALKQYGLLEGKSTAYMASDLARQINSAPPEDMQNFLRSAALHPSVFKTLFDTFHGDDVSRARLRQRVLDLNVHPEEAERCVDVYVSSMATAGLITASGDKLAHLSQFALGESAPPHEVNDESGRVEEGVGGDESADARDEATDPVESLDRRSPRAVFNVNVTLDSSLDIEKLSKQLEVLKRFGAI